MDKNKDKRNFLDEEKEIEKLLSEFESENIKIPGELDERLNVKLKELKPKKYKKWAVTSVASILIIGVSFALKIETETGYYECQKCHNKYVPKYSKVYFAMHFGTTRYMKCPKCNEKSWQRKVLSK